MESIQRHGVDTLIDQPTGDLGEIGRRLTADADVFAGLAARLNGHFHKSKHGRIALVVAAQQAGITIYAQAQLRHVVGADGEAVNPFQELIGQHGVGGNLAHHDDFKAIATAFEAIAGQ